MEGLKGYIYIEAYKQQHVKQAIEDIGNLRMGRWQQLMVPIREMTDVMRVVKDTSGIKQGSWVRIKRGIFKDDVAQVRVSCDLSCDFGEVLCEATLYTHARIVRRTGKQMLCMYIVYYTGEDCFYMSKDEHFILPRCSM